MAKFDHNKFYHIFAIIKFSARISTAMCGQFLDILFLTGKVLSTLLSCERINPYQKEDVIYVINKVL